MFWRTVSCKSCLYKIDHRLFFCLFSTFFFLIQPHALPWKPSLLKHAEGDCRDNLLYKMFHKIYYECKYSIQKKNNARKKYSNLIEKWEYFFKSMYGSFKNKYFFVFLFNMSYICTIFVIRFCNSARTKIGEQPVVVLK